MKFLCLGYINETNWNAFTEKEQADILDAYFHYNQDLKQNNIFISGFGLKSVSESCKIVMTDGQVKETSLKPDVEQIGGFIIIEAKNLSEAKTIISKHPGLRVGAFEIRPIDDDISELVGSK
jgi:hypothetical protein